MNIKLLNRSTKFLALLYILSVMVAGCRSSPATVVPSNVPTLASATGTYWPTEGWRTSTPEEQGMDPQKLADMLATIQERQMKIHIVIAIQ